MLCQFYFKALKNLSVHYVQYWTNLKTVSNDLLLYQQNLM